MCRLCVEWELGKLTTKEAKNNLKELIVFSSDEEREHYEELANKLYEDGAD